MGATISDIFSNLGSKNVASFVVRGIGAIPTGGAQTADSVLPAPGGLCEAWKTPAIAGTVVGQTAGAALSAFTKINAAYDFCVYGLGGLQCW